MEPLDKNDALESEKKYRTAVETASDYIENFDILETITNVGNDEVFTPRKTCTMILDSLPDEVWHNSNYRWLNPATKNGIFEREIAIRLDEGLKDVIPDMEKRRKHILQDMIFAIGQTKFTANVARRTVYYCSQANRKCDGIKAVDGHYVNGYAIGNGTWFNDAEGNIKTPCTDHVFVKGKCKFCGIPETSKYNDKTQRERYSYEFIHIEQKDLLAYLQNRFFGGNRLMKFDIIIGNPPYQLDDGGNGSSAIPIYQLFVQQAISLKPKYLSMIIPARWYAGGKGLNEFRNTMLNDEHISKLTDFVNAKDCFESFSIGGGVCFFLRDDTYKGKCEFSSIKDGIISKSIRVLNEFPTFVRYDDGVTILKKIQTKTNSYVSDFVVSRNPFGLPSKFRGEKCKDGKNSITVLSSGGISYTDPKKITAGKDIIDKFKVVISKATSEHAGEPNKDGKFTVVSTLKLLKDQEVCTDSYIVIFSSDNENEARNYFEYVKTKFYRFLLLLSVSSINLSKEKFQYIPTVDFKNKIDDKSLYNFFGLTEEESLFIENLIKEKK